MSKFSRKTSSSTTPSSVLHPSSMTRTESALRKLLFQARLDEILSAFEFVDHLDSVQNPLASSIYNFYVLIKTTGSNESKDRENVDGFIVGCTEKWFSGKANVVGYGHLRDGNLHLNVSAPQYDYAHGSIIAEHGLGLMKAEKIYYNKSTATDYDPYVRKIAAICVAKLYDINDKLVEDRGFLVLLMCIVSNKVVAKLDNKFL
ncbi:unnamed protein product [Lactuca saligna]|uniref:Condensin complex subunit 1 C-terminal domain-containing protein n=1 Tax=Lactuca saligna TaxID=75948 RepID=A0AA35VVE2_LACSI|nr:unnamed protein product [Lactuca saligna]